MKSGMNNPLDLLVIILSFPKNHCYPELFKGMGEGGREEEGKKEK